MRDDTRLSKFQTQTGETFPKVFIVSIVDDSGQLDVSKTRKFFSEAGLIPPSYDTDLMTKILESAHLIIAYYRRGQQFYK